MTTSSICVVCGVGFERPRKSKRMTCSNKCRAVFGWQQQSAENRQKRLAEMSRVQTLHGAGQRLNRTRWTGERSVSEREKLSQWNLERWANPEIKEQLSQLIRERNGTPEKRRFYSELRKRNWQDPVYRERVTEIIRKSHNTEEYRNLASQLLRARWRDPVLRQKYLAAVTRTSRLPWVREKNRIRMQQRWAKQRELKRPPITEQPLVRPPLPEPKRIFSMFEGRLRLPDRPVWRRTDML